MATYLAGNPDHRDTTLPFRNRFFQLTLLCLFIFPSFCFAGPGISAPKERKLNVTKEKKRLPLQGGIAALYRFPSNDVTGTIGGSIFLFYDKFHPLVFGFSGEFGWLSLKSVFPDEHVFMTSPGLEIQFHPSSSRIQPYLGSGIGYFHFFWPTDNPPSELENNGVRGGGTINYGSAWLGYAKGGVSYSLNNNVSLFCETKLLFDDQVDMPITVYYFPGILSNETIPYRVGQLSIKFGVLLRFID